MIVYLATYWASYESEDPLGVYDNIEAAKEAAQAHHNNWYKSAATPLEWEAWRDQKIIAHADQNNSYVVYTMTLNEAWEE